jgi:hypothetical protein
MPSPVINGSAIEVSIQLEHRYSEDPSNPLMAVVVDPMFLHSVGVPLHVALRPHAVTAVREELCDVLADPLVKDRLKIAALSTILQRS